MTKNILTYNASVFLAILLLFMACWPVMFGRYYAIIILLFLAPLYWAVVVFRYRF